MNDFLFGNNNRQTTKMLSARYFRANKSRNIIAVIAIALTTILFATIFTLGSGFLETVHEQNIRKAGGDGQAVLSNINDKIYQDIAGSDLLSQIGYTKSVSYHLNNSGLSQWRADMWYMDDTSLSFARYNLKEGRFPQGETEIAVDTKTLDALGVPAKIGETISITYDVKGIEYTTDFTLTGFWETDPLSGMGHIVVSKAYIDAHSDILTYTYPKDNDYSGVVTAYLMFRGSGNIEDKLNDLLTQTGYRSVDGTGAAEGITISARVSPAYESSTAAANPALLFAAIAGLLLIVATGYLIIYNIFQISVLQDIQSYGQLKTLGTTQRQIKKMINQQALALCVVGIPIGLLVGFFIGKALVPYLMNGTIFSSADGVSVSVNPWIFIGSALFSFFTVALSIRKPIRIAGTVSPIEAIRYTEGDTSAYGDHGSDKKHTTRNGAKIPRMALSNLGRNKKRTILVITSMTLSIVLLNTVFTLSSGFDVDKYIAKFVQSDFVISTSDYFNFQFESSEYDLSESLIQSVVSQPGFENGGRLYTTRSLEEGFSVENENITGFNTDDAGNPLVDLYGADDFLLNNMEVVEGAVDWQALRSGKYTLLGLESDDNGNVIENNGVKVGDTITFHHFTRDGLSISRDKTTELTVMAKVRIHENTDTVRSNSATTRFYLPTEVYLPLCHNPHLVSYSYNVGNESEAEMEQFLTDTIETSEPNIAFDSKETYTGTFRQITMLVTTIGGALCFVIGLIGIVNFTNSVLTSILTRRREFAMLQSIGMTGKQLKQMLSCEGLYYAIMTILATLIMGTLFSVVIVRVITNSVWFFTYHFVILPMLVVYPFLIVVTMLIPILLYRQLAKSSIIERLHQN